MSLTPSVLAGYKSKNSIFHIQFYFLLSVVYNKYGIAHILSRYQMVFFRVSCSFVVVDCIHNSKYLTICNYFWLNGFFVCSGREVFLFLQMQFVINCLIMTSHQNDDLLPFVYTKTNLRSHFKRSDLAKYMLYVCKRMKNFPFHRTDSMNHFM